jgi:hypothetical protein
LASLTGDGDGDGDGDGVAEVADEGRDEAPDVAELAGVVLGL